MKIKLDYGKSKLEIEVNDKNILHVLENKPVKPMADIKKKLVESLRDPIGSPALEEKIKGKKNICIVISDITRAVPTKLILETILPEIHSYGISRDCITILVATGLHRPNEGAELKKLVGEDIFDNYNIVNHIARDKDGCRLIGKTKKGTPIILNRTYLDSDFKMLTGLIEPHFMAGFSGGRKAICPGISYVDMFKHFHGPAILEAAKTTTGIINGNPFHEEATEIARKAGADFLANVTINKNKDHGYFCRGPGGSFFSGSRILPPVQHIPDRRRSRYRNNYRGRLSPGYKLVPGRKRNGRCHAGSQAGRDDHTCGTMHRRNREQRVCRTVNGGERLR